MIVRFKADTELSYDGINKRVYTNGSLYTPNHPRELSVFKHMVQTGNAEIVTDVAPSPEPNKPSATKIRKPRQSK